MRQIKVGDRVTCPDVPTRELRVVSLRQTSIGQVATIIDGCGEEFDVCSAFISLSETQVAMDTLGWTR